MSGTLVLRADASAQIGTGHVMRCLALAQAWQDGGGQATFVQCAEVPLLSARLAAEGLAVVRLGVQPGGPEDATQTAELASRQEAVCTVVDGYHFGTTYLQALKTAGLRVLVLDDTGHIGHYIADFVLNQNISADEALYRNREPYTQLLLGTRYALLRREFSPWRGWQRTLAPTARKILVTLGGSDPDNVTARVVEALLRVDMADLEVHVVVGGSNPHLAALQAGVQGHPGFRLRHHLDDMPTLMAWVDMAISGSGSTCWELAFMGLPSLLVVLADNQAEVATALAARSAAINLGWHASLSPETITQATAELALASAHRARLSEQMRMLVDGVGAARVLRAIAPADGLTLRLAHAADCRTLWEWANDPGTRAASFSSELIPWSQHVAWFEARLANPQYRFYIALDSAAQPVGQIRFQLEGNDATVSVALAPAERGLGYGSQIIRLGAEQIFNTTEVQVIHAYVKPDNQASVRAFGRAAFVRAGTASLGQQTALHLVLRKEGLP